MMLEEILKCEGQGEGINMKRISNPKPQKKHPLSPRERARARGVNIKRISNLKPLLPQGEGWDEGSKQAFHSSAEFFYSL